jgi:hypothetical protein
MTAMKTVAAPRQAIDIMDKLAGATGPLEFSNFNRLPESGAFSDPVTAAHIPHWCPTGIPTRLTRFHAKAMIA